MEIRIFSDGNTYLALAEDGTYAVGSKLTVERNLEQLHKGHVTRLPCNRTLFHASAWAYLTNEEPVATITLKGIPQWLS